MTNEEVLIQTLSSVDFQTAKTAIKSFYRAIIKDRAMLRDEALALAKEYIAEAHVKRPPVTGATVVMRSEPKKNEQEKSVVGTESLSSLSCPKCGDNLEHSTVCPSCSAGRSGYRHRYICTCGVSFVTLEEL